MTSVGTLNDFLSQKVRAIVSDTQQLVHGRRTVGPDQFDWPGSLSSEEAKDKYGAWVGQCDVELDDTDSAVEFSGLVCFFDGPFSEALVALRFDPRIRFCFTATDYSYAGLDFYGIHLDYSPLSIEISMDPAILVEFYENNGLFEGFDMEMLRHCEA